MKYFKMIQNNIIIGAITSDNFFKFQPLTNCFSRSNEEEGEYVSYNGQVYRGTWMKVSSKIIPCIEVLIIEITEQEYHIYEQAIETNEVIEEYNEEVEDEPYIDINDTVSIEFIRQSKINEMSMACRQTIEAGFDLELRNELHHFSLNTQDQLNLISLGVMAQTQSLIPYHADGEDVIFYTNEEINEIVDTANAFKIYHTTYYNALKGYINALETIEAISEIEYGIEIPNEYKTNVLRALEG